MKNHQLSLIISFYNKIDRLKLVFAALEMQTFRNFEILIADDGSSPEVVAELNRIIEKSQFPIKHLWHEDKGWRKNIILNKALMACSTDYVVFIDGDCVPHPRFLEEHFTNRAENTVLVGRRMFLSEFITKRLTEKKIKRGYLQYTSMVLSFFLRMIKKGNHFENGIYIRSPFIRKRINKKIKGIVGSNFSIHKKDLMEINGFDERFLYPGAGEDSDVRNRLKHKGINIKSVKFLAVQYHLYHKELERDKRNLVFLNENLDKKVIYTPYGIHKQGE